MSDVVIFGTGSFAQVAYHLLTFDSRHDVVAFALDRGHIETKQMFGLPIVPFEEIKATFPPHQVEMFVAVGYRSMNRIRAEKYVATKDQGYELISYVSSRSAFYGETIGDNCFIFDNTSIQPFVRVGNNVTIWSGSCVSHHTTIADHCFLGPGVTIAGHVSVGAFSFLGAGATVRDTVEIGQSCLIGAGSLIMESTQDFSVYVADQTKVVDRSSNEFLL